MDFASLVFHEGCDGLRQWLYGGIAVLVLAGIITYGFISAPKVIRLDRELQVTAYKLEDTSYAKTVNVTLKGAFAEKTNSYTGKLAVNGVQYVYCELNPDLGLMFCAQEGPGSRMSSLGQVYADSGYKTWSLALQKGDTAPGYDANSFFYAVEQAHNAPEDTMILSYSAANREAAIQQYEALRGEWLKKWTDNMK